MISIVIEGRRMGVGEHGKQRHPSTVGQPTRAKEEAMNRTAAVFDKAKAVGPAYNDTVQRTYY
jgi:hypothetical protein